MLPAPILVVAKLAGILDALRIRYVVGGSVASSIYGIPRATQDVDIVADMQLSNVEVFANALSGEFYVDADMIGDAIRRRASFNVIHLATMFKADIFILQGDSWSREEQAPEDSACDWGAQERRKYTIGRNRSWVGLRRQISQEIALGFVRSRHPVLHGPGRSLYGGREEEDRKGARDARGRRR